MGLVMDHAGTAGGYEAVPLALGRGGLLGGRAVLRRRSARPSRRGVVYVLCLGDEFVPDDVVSWYTDRGFHFYAADLREVGRPTRARYDAKAAAEDLGECFRSLDAAAAHLREADAIDMMVVCGHGSGALIAALWCHARRGSRLADALILARPLLGRPHPAVLPSWRPRGSPPDSPLLEGARRRLRLGLDIACPVLVMCPATGWEVPGGAGGLLPPQALAGRRATIRLGEHVTWLKLPPGGPASGLVGGRRRFFDELGRWLGAYLSGEIRDQLL
jgi:hypothetical protein